MTKVLIVDDNPMFRQILSSQLSAAGLILEDAVSGSQAQAMIKTAAPDLVILDHMMPNGDGPSLVRWIRAQPQFKTLPLIMLTARNSGDDKAFAFQAGVDDYVVKPFHPAELLHRMDRLLVRVPVP